MKNLRFNALIHAPKRLHICAMLSASGELEFKLLREQLDVSDSVLSKHIKSLQEAGYVTVAKKKGFWTPTHMDFVNLCGSWCLYRTCQRTKGNGWLTT